MENNARYWLWFSMTFSPGNERIWEILSQYNDVKSAYEDLKTCRAEYLNEQERRSIKTTHIEQCDSIIEYCENRGYDILTFDDERYPVLLRNIYNPPAVLFCMGDIGCLASGQSISCVGARKASEYSLKATETICREIAVRGFTIVSGFAVGIDSAAHRGALKAGERTCAVLACGLDVDYPSENTAAKKLIAKSGVIITEYFPGTRPNRYCFHTRNRIISGLSFGTLVVEASEGSGSLITANHAVEQGRTLFCIPPRDIFDKRYSGVVKYLRDGAIPIFDHLDILYEYYSSVHSRGTGKGFDWPELSGNGEVPVKKVRKRRTKSGSRKNTGIDLTYDAERKNESAENLLSGLSDEQAVAVDFLRKNGASEAESISDALCMDHMEVLALMTELEIMGAVTLDENKKFRLLIN